jgi:hypothetical protein
MYKQKGVEMGELKSYSCNIRFVIFGSLTLLGIERVLPLNTPSSNVFWIRQDAYCDKPIISLINPNIFKNSNYLDSTAASLVDGEHPIMQFIVLF